MCGGAWRPPGPVEIILHLDRRGRPRSSYPREWHKSTGKSACATKSSNQFEAREEIADFERCGFGRVGAVGDVVADARAEIVANGARRSLFRVGSAHDVAPLRNGAFRF